MAQHIINKKDINDVFWLTLMSCLNFDLIEEKDKVRKLYQRGGAPDFAHDDNIIWFESIVIDTVGNYEQRMYREYTNDEQLITRYNNELRLHITSYGPNSYDLLEEIKYAIFLPHIKQIYEDKYIYISSKPFNQQEMTENINGSEWWTRYDMDIRFKHQIERKIDWAHISGLRIDVMPENMETRHIILKEE